MKRNRIKRKAVLTPVDSEQIRKQLLGTRRHSNDPGIA